MESSDAETCGWFWSCLHCCYVTAAETSSNAGPLFPLKDFMGLPTHHILRSLPYWLLKGALSTMPGPPRRCFMGLLVGRAAPRWAARLRLLWEACLLPWNTAALLSSAWSIPKGPTLSLLRCLLVKGSVCTKVFNVGPWNENKSFISKVGSVSFGISGIKLIHDFCFPELVKCHKFECFARKFDVLCICRLVYECPWMRLRNSLPLLDNYVWNNMLTALLPLSWEQDECCSWWEQAAALPLPPVSAGTVFGMGQAASWLCSGSISNCGVL